MLYPPMSDLLENVNSRYLMVNVVARRARQISIEAQSLNEYLDEKPVSMAIKEVAAGKLTASLKPEGSQEEQTAQVLEELDVNEETTPYQEEEVLPEE